MNDNNNLNNNVVEPSTVISDNVEPVINVEPVLTENIKSDQKNKKLGLIITIILALLVLYAAGYTVYFVFLVPSETQEVKDPSENVSLLLQKGNELLSLVPILNNYDSAYQHNPAIYDNVDSEALFSTILNYYKQANEVTVLSDELCMETDECFSVSYDALNNIIKEHYGINLILEQKDYVLSEDNSCIYENNNFNCYYKNYNDQEFDGTINVIETVRESEETLFVYETALFVENLVIENNIVNIEELMLLPSVGQRLEQNYSINYTANYEEQILNIYSANAKMFKHEFKNVDGNFVWIKTSPVSSIEG